MIGNERQMRKRLLMGYVALYLLSPLIWQLTVGRRNPDLLKERLRPGPGAKEGRLAMALLYGLPWLGHYALAALDLRRFHWSRPIPARLQAAGFAGFLATFAAICWVATVNPFFSSVVRIQRERGHRVITTGPYRFIRHPGYAIGSLFFVFSALALGSWWGLLPSLFLIPALIRRTIIEDRVLHEELEGYPTYAQRVRYRLAPGLW